MCGVGLELAKWDTAILVVRSHFLPFLDFWYASPLNRLLSIWHWLIVGAVVLLVFGGRNKISDMMGDVARGIKAFKKGMSDDETAENSAKTDAAVKTIDHQADIKRRAESESKV